MQIYLFNSHFIVFAASATVIRMFFLPFSRTPFNLNILNIFSRSSVVWILLDLRRSKFHFRFASFLRRFEKRRKRIFIFEPCSRERKKLFFHLIIRRYNIMPSSHRELRPIRLNPFECFDINKSVIS